MQVWSLVHYWCISLYVLAAPRKPYEVLSGVMRRSQETDKQEILLHVTTKCILNTSAVFFASAPQQLASSECSCHRIDYIVKDCVILIQVGDREEWNATWNETGSSLEYEKITAYSDLQMLYSN